MAPLSQAEASQYMYSARVEKYENSWHPHYSSRFVCYVNPQPGQRILDLCCGTGLDLFLIAEALNKDADDAAATDGGLVVGIDTTAEMLAVAEQRRQARPELAHRIQLFLHDVTTLETLEPSGSGIRGADGSAVAPGSFDAIVCSSAFVLFDDPDAVVTSWRQYLKAPAHSAATHIGHSQSKSQNELGGALVVDIPHEAAQRGGLAMERVARRLGLRFPSNRSWVQSVDSFRAVLERNGYVVERVVELDNVSGQGPKYYTADQAGELYDTMSKSSAFEAMAAGAGPGIDVGDIVERGRPIFKEEFLRDADTDGLVFVSDTIYVYVARPTAG